MTFYNSVDNDLYDYLTGQTKAPDSVIQKAFDESRLYIGALLPDADLPEDAEGVHACIRAEFGEANPKWRRDEWRIEVLSMGSGRHQYREAETLINEIVHTLLGNKTIYIGDMAYYQFNSNALPRFFGYMEGSKPLFRATFTVVAEGLTDKFNREALC